MLIQDTNSSLDPQQVFDACQKLTDMSPEKYSQVKHGTLEVNLRDEVPLLRRLAEMFSHITLEDIQVLSGNDRARLAQEINRSHDALTLLVRASPESLAKPHQIIQRIKQEYGSIRKSAMEFTSHPSSSGHHESLLLDAGHIVNQMTALAEDAKRVHKKTVEASQRTVVAESANAFDKASKRHAKERWVWLAVATGVALATVIMGWTLIARPVSGDIGEAAGFIAARLITFGILSYALVWASRNYRAAAHNQIVNEHRHDALQTFEVFTDPATDEATRNTVLIQATKCIYAHRPSGFGQNQQDGEPSSHVLELTRHIASGKG
ncbi:MAG: hypothetical protein OXE73_09490 [Gammaproteobacteria bacterium]|nr:hypothetical protein [Gammaproteobacteria bacterium]